MLGIGINFVVLLLVEFILKFFKTIEYYQSYETSSRRKQADRTKRSHHRRSPTSSRHGHRQRHRDEREERSNSTSRRRHRDRGVKDRSPIKVKKYQFEKKIKLHRLF